MFGLEPKKPVRQYIQDVWQTDDGLPQNYVVAIVQTHEGYIWLATQEGIARFDGIRFTVFDKRNTEQIKDNNIQALFEDRQGNLWFGTEGGGLTKYSGGTFTTFSRQDGLSGDIIDAIYQDNGGALWIGTPNGLSRLKDGAFSNYSTKDGLANDSVLAICEDAQGSLWFGTENGLSRLKDGRFSTYTTRDGLANNLVRSIYRDTGGNLWIGTRDGLNKLVNDRFITYSRKQNLANSSVLSICEDRDGNLWIGTDGGGLSRFKDGIFTTYAKEDGLSDNSVAAICEDREGNLWVGTYGGGLNRLKNGRFVSYTAQHGLSDNMARAIYEDSEGGLWIGTRDGLNRLKDGKFTVYTVSQGLANNSVLSIYEDTKGDLWIGTRAGLSRLKNGRFTTYTTKNGLSDDTVLSITEAQDGGLWIGTSQGLNLLRNGIFTPYKTRDGLTNEGVWALLEDPNRVLWIGTDGGGLNRWENGKFLAYSSRDGLANDVVMSIYQDEEGTLWVGTSGGLSRFKNGEFTNYTSQVGLFDDVVFQILQDGVGNLWMSCNKGVFRVSKTDLDDFADGRVKSITCVSYGTTDGMKSRECNGGFQPAGWKSKDGRLWFPTVKGVAVVDPNRIRINDHVPPVIIEQVTVDNALINTTENIRFAPGKERFEFHFAALSYVAPEKVQFKYKLEGFDGDWIDAGTHRDASYTHIPAGHYRFHVVASNNDLIWNLNGASFEFYLQPHFYQTYWFYASCAVMAGLLGWLLYHFRVRQMSAEFAAVLTERTRLAREIHDTLTQCFVGIALQLEAASGEMVQSPESAQQRLKMADKIVRSSLAEARRYVWDLRPQALEQGNLVSALSEVAQQLTAGTSVEAQVKVHGKARRLPNLIESHLLRIGQESLSNALKHARPNTVLIELSFDRRLIRLCVTDDGCGFETKRPFSANSGHFGLIGMQERVDQIGGHLEVRSSAGHGTAVDVSVPVD